MQFNSIPTVDLNEYLLGDAAQKQAFAQKIGDTFSGIGFAIVANHGVPQSVIDGA